MRVYIDLELEDSIFVSAYGNHQKKTLPKNNKNNGAGTSCGGIAALTHSKTTQDWFWNKYKDQIICKILDAVLLNSTSSANSSSKHNNNNNNTAKDNNNNSQNQTTNNNKTQSTVIRTTEELNLTEEEEEEQEQREGNSAAAFRETKYSVPRPAHNKKDIHDILLGSGCSNCTIKEQQEQSPRSQMDSQAEEQEDEEDQFQRRHQYCEEEEQDDEEDADDDDDDDDVRSCLTCRRCSQALRRCSCGCNLSSIGSNNPCRMHPDDEEKEDGSRRFDETNNNGVGTARRLRSTSLRSSNRGCSGRSSCSSSSYRCRSQQQPQQQQHDRDIEVLDETVRKLRAECDRLQHRNALQLRHFASMSHEIRTPLNAIIGLSSLLLREGNFANDPTTEEAVRMIVSSGELLLTVVNDVLDYSKLESGNVDIEIQQSDFQLILDNIIHSLQVRAQDRNVTIQTEYDPALPRLIQTDSRRMQQILYNLLGNALKFAPEGSDIEFRAQIFEKPLHSQPNNAFGMDEWNASTTDVTMTDFSESTLYTTTTERFLASSHGEDVTESSAPFARALSFSSPMKKSVASSNRICDLAATSITDQYEDTDGEDDLQLCLSPMVQAQRKLASFAGKTTVACNTAPSSSAQPSQSRSCLTPCSRKMRSNPRKSSNHPVKTGRFLRMIVKDYGQGIPKKHFSRIFKPFLQSGANNHGGTGLGLAITSQLVSRLGGTISVDSEEGEWAEFTVDLPLLEDPVDVSIASQCLDDVTVLIVGSEPADAPHDDGQNREVMYLKSVLDWYKVKNLEYNHINELEEAICSQDLLSSNEKYICVIDEGLCSSLTLFEKISRTPETYLITYGGNKSLNQSKYHFRYLAQVLPSVIIQAMIDARSATDRSVRGTANTTGSRHAKKLSSSSLCSKQELSILVAEDNMINQKVLSRMLKQLGFEFVDIVDNGAKAVEFEAAREYDAILMDMEMPVMNGIEATHEIMKRHGGHPKPKIVFVTAHASHSFEAECIEAGASGFLAKPYNIHDLENCLKRIRQMGEPPPSVPMSPCPFGPKDRISKNGIALARSA